MGTNEESSRYRHRDGHDGGNKSVAATLRAGKSGIVYSDEQEGAGLETLLRNTD